MNELKIKISFLNDMLNTIIEYEDLENNIHQMLVKASNLLFTAEGLLIEPDLNGLL